LGRQRDGERPPFLRFVEADDVGLINAKSTARGDGLASLDCFQLR